jgi:predicted acylesterase/phospholipase RssA
MTIKHLILTGGGPIGFVEYGALKYLATTNIINYNNIQSIYAVSIGAFVGFIYTLNLEWLWVDDFIIKRPWNKLVRFSYTNLLYEKGIITRTDVVNALEPLFLTKNIPLTITLLEFYNLTKIEFNIYACTFTTLQQKKFNHITTPNIMLVDALYVSLAIPLIFAPLIIDDCFYLDGAIIQGCPINNCIAEKQCDHSEILCFINDKTNPIDLSNVYHSASSVSTSTSTVSTVSNNINFFKYFYLLFNTWFMNISNIENEIIVHIKNSINVALIHNGANLKYWNYILNTDTERTHLINLGTLQAKKFISTLELELENDPNPICSNQIQIETEVETEVETQAVSKLVDRKLLYVLNSYFKSVLYIFYIYFIVILYIFYKNIKI